jgi:hypothetical protein
MKPITLFAILAIGLTTRCFSEEEKQCCPEPTGTKVCCEGDVIDPAHKTSATISLDLSSGVQTAKDAANKCKFQGTGLAWEGGTSLQFSVTDSTYQDCCTTNGSKKKTNISEDAISVDVDFGKGCATWNITSGSVPSWLGQAYVQLSVGFKIGIHGLTLKTTCASSEFCGSPVNGNATLGGEVGGAFAGGYIKVSAGVEGSGTIGMKICLSSANSASVYPKDIGATLDGVKAYTRVQCGGISIDPYYVDLMGS